MMYLCLHNFSIPLIICWPSFTQKKSVPIFQRPDMPWSYNLNCEYPLANELIGDHHQRDRVTLSQKILLVRKCNTLATWPKWWDHVSSPLSRTITGQSFKRCANLSSKPFMYKKNISNLYKEVSVDSNEKVFERLMEHVKKYEYSIVYKMRCFFLLALKMFPSEVIQKCFLLEPAHFSVSG